MSNSGAQPKTPVASSIASGFVSSPRGEQNKVVPPPLAGNDQSKLAAIMARQRQAADSGEQPSVEEMTVETFEEIIDEDTDNDDVVEEVIEEDQEGTGEDGTEGEEGERGEGGDEEDEDGEGEEAGDPDDEDQANDDDDDEDDPEDHDDNDDHDDPDVDIDDDDMEEEDVDDGDDGDDVDDGEADVVPQMNTSGSVMNASGSVMNASGSAMNASESEMSVEEFDKNNPRVVPPARASPRMSRSPQEASQDPVELDDGMNNANQGALPNALPGALPDVDEQTPQDGYGENEQGAYSNGAYSASDQYDQGSFGQYGNDQYSQQRDGDVYDDDAAFGTAGYGQRDYMNNEQEERFIDEEQPPAAPVAYDPRVSKARTVDSMDEYRLCFCLAVACLFLVLALGGVFTILVLWIKDDNDTVEQTVTSTPPPVGAPRDAPVPTASPVPPTGPTVAPRPSIPPVPSAPQPVTARLAQTEQSTQPGLGTSLALAGPYMVIGDPNVGDGQVQTYRKTESSSDYAPAAVASASTNNAVVSKFGTAVDMVILSDGSPAMLVGATRTRASLVVRGEEVNEVYGSAHYFTFDGSQWSELGGAIRGGLAVEETSGLFGHAVALAADVQRIVVSAPSSSKNFETLDTGKVYTYTFADSSWTLTGSVLEGDARSMTGWSVALSRDGNRLLVGAPGKGTDNGQFSYHEWSGSEWTQVLSEAGPSSSSFGWSLDFIDSDASSFAVGGPTANSGAGVVIVYAESSSAGSEKYAQLGDPIQGEAGEGIGRTVCGKDGMVAFGTNGGFVRMYAFENGSWVLQGSFRPGSNVPLDCSFSDDATTISVGTSDSVKVYELTG